MVDKYFPRIMLIVVQYSHSFLQVMDGRETGIDDGTGDLVPLTLLLPLNPAALADIPPQILGSRNGRIK